MKVNSYRSSSIVGISILPYAGIEQLYFANILIGKITEMIKAAIFGLNRVTIIQYIKT